MLAREQMSINWHEYLLAGKLRAISSYSRSDFLEQHSSWGRKNKNKKSNQKQMSRRLKVEVDLCLTGMRQQGRLWQQQPEFKWSSSALLFHVHFLGGITSYRNCSALHSRMLSMLSKKCQDILGVQVFALVMQSLWVLDQITCSCTVW